jgi:hypothetical protein
MYIDPSIAIKYGIRAINPKPTLYNIEEYVQRLRS